MPSPMRRSSSSGQTSRTFRKHSRALAYLPRRSSTPPSMRTASGSLGARASTLDSDRSAASYSRCAHSLRARVSRRSLTRERGCGPGIGGGSVKDVTALLTCGMDATGYSTHAQAAKNGCASELSVRVERSEAKLREVETRETKLDALRLRACGATLRANGPLRHVHLNHTQKNAGHAPGAGEFADSAQKL